MQPHPSKSARRTVSQGHSPVGSEGSQRVSGGSTDEHRHDTGFDSLDEQSPRGNRTVTRKRQLHNEYERKRRENLSHHFEDLRDALKELGRPHDSKTEVLQGAVSVCRKEAKTRLMRHDDPLDTIPGLRDVVEYVASLKARLHHASGPASASTSSLSIPPPLMHQEEGDLELSNVCGRNDLHTANSALEDGRDALGRLASALETQRMRQRAAAPYSLSSMSMDNALIGNSVHLMGTGGPDMDLFAVQHTTAAAAEPPPVTGTTITPDSTVLLDVTRAFMVMFLGVGLLWNVMWHTSGEDGNGLNRMGSRVLAGAKGSRMELLPGLEWVVVSWVFLYDSFLQYPKSVLVIAFLLLYALIITLGEPARSPNSYTYAQACQAFQDGEQSQGATARKKRYMLALAFLGRPLPKVTTYVIALACFQLVRFFLHSIFVGLWIERAAMYFKGAKPSMAKASEIYLNLVRRCSDCLTTPQLVCMIFTLLNVTEAGGNVTQLAEVYAHVGFVVEMKFTRVRWLNSLCMQKAWSAAKAADRNTHLAALMFSTGCHGMHQARWQEADFYFRQSKLLSTHMGFSMELHAGSLLGMSLIEYGRGNLYDAQQLCTDAIRVSSPTALSTLNCILTLTACLLETRGKGQAKASLETIALTAFQPKPNRSECVQLKIAAAAYHSLVSQILMDAGDTDAASHEAIETLDAAKALGGNPIFCWPAYLCFEQVLLDVWEAALRRASSAPTENADESCPEIILSAGSDGEGEKSRRASAESVKLLPPPSEDKMHRASVLGSKVLDGIGFLDKIARDLPCMSVATQRMKGTYFYLSGDLARAERLWAQCIEEASRRQMLLEEAKCWLERARHAPVGEWRVHCFRLADGMFDVCGAERHHSKMGVADT